MRVNQENTITVTDAAGKEIEFTAEQVVHLLGPLWRDEVEFDDDGTIDPEDLARYFPTPEAVILAQSAIALLLTERATITVGDVLALQFIEEVFDKHDDEKEKRQVALLEKAKLMPIKQLMDETRGEWMLEAYNSLIFKAMREVIDGGKVEEGQKIGIWKFVSMEDGRKGFYSETTTDAIEKGSHLILQKPDGTISVTFKLGEEFETTAVFAEGAVDDRDETTAEVNEESEEEPLDEKLEERMITLFDTTTVEILWLLNDDLIDYLCGNEVSMHDETIEDSLGDEEDELYPTRSTVQQMKDDEEESGR